MSAPNFDEINNIEQNSPRILTMTEKIKMIDKLIERDRGFACFFCKDDLKLYSFDFEHLNNDRNDNRMENIVLACHPCNIRKIHNDSLQSIASQKFKQNIIENFLRERKNESQYENTSMEIQINVSANKILRQYVEEEISEKGFVEWNDAHYSGVYLIQKQTNHGSSQSVREYLKVLTSKAAPFETSTNNEGKKIIIRKEPQKNVQQSELNVLKTDEREKENIDHNGDAFEKDPGLKEFHAIGLDWNRLVEPKNEDKITLFTELHAEEKCETCDVIGEIQEESKKIAEVNLTNINDLKEDLLPLVGHCTSFFCNRPTFDGEHWCSMCVGFWKKMLDYPQDTIPVESTLPQNVWGKVC